MRVFFAGLGTMGAPMARNLWEHGLSLIVYNRSAGPEAWFRERGVRVVDSPAAGAAEADAIVTMLADDEAVRAVLADPQSGCLSALSPGTLVMDSSTVSPVLSRWLSRACADRGASFLDAPVTGSAPQAAAGTLTFMVGGDRSAFERAAPLFDAMGRRAVLMGDSGAGSIAKLANNVMAALNMVAVAEGLSLIQASGLDRTQFLDMIEGGGAHNGMARTKREKLLNDEYSPDFAARLMLKDLTLADGLAAGLGVPLPGLETARTLYQIQCRTGGAEADIAGLCETYQIFRGAGKPSEKRRQND